MSTQKDLFGRLADAGEDALSKLAEMPGGHRAIEAMNQLKNRIDELQQRVRSLDPLERRVTELEQRLEALEQKRSTRSARKAP
jgi:polyhydroxyalkanoate synthesis regulator phasin